MEEDSWRDQPLWCHTLERFHVKPVKMDITVFREDKERKGNKGHRYSAAQDSDAAANSSATTP
jgi:pyrimidine operon attenuation protein/uracil phosphoribosyltransferase